MAKTEANDIFYALLTGCERVRDQLARDCWLAGIELWDLHGGSPPKNATEVTIRARFLTQQSFPAAQADRVLKNIRETNPK